MQYSTTAAVLEPGRLATGMPRAVAAATGIMSSPTPWRTTARSLGAWSNTSGASWARTISPSTSAISRARVAGEASGATITSQCSASTGCNCGWIALVSKTLGLAGLSLAFKERHSRLHRVDQSAKPFKFNRDSAARHQPGGRRVHRRDARRRAGGNDVARIERHAVR